MGCRYYYALIGLLVVPVFILFLAGLYVSEHDYTAAIPFFIIGIILLITWIAMVYIHYERDE